jgi:class 3 adenylate cyclase/CHASE2 domain-containing sensor protein
LKRQQWAPAWASLILVVALHLVLQLGWLAPRWRRVTELLRDPIVRANSFRVAVDPRIVVVTVDDLSLAVLREPTTYWLPYFGKAIRACLNSGAVAVGLDWMVYDIDESVYQAVFHTKGPPVHPWYELGLAVIDHPNQWVQGVFPSIGEASSQQMAQNGNYRPAPELSALAGGPNLGYLNMSLDFDGVLRRQAVLPIQVDAGIWGIESCSSFDGRLAEIAGVDLRSIPLDPGGLLRIAYAEPIKIPEFPLSGVVYDSVHNPSRLKREFAGKTVLIGVATNLFHDRVLTPVGDMWGVEAHAMTLNTLLTRTFYTMLPIGQQLALLWLFGCLAGFTGTRLHPVTLIFFQMLLCAAAFALSSWALSEWGKLINVAELIASVLLCGSAGWLFQWVHQQREQSRVRKLFGRYVSASVMEELLKDPAQAVLGAIGKRELTVLFTDINGFSTQCEKRTAEEIMTMLNAYFEEMNGIIFRHGGTIKQFVGDEIMVMYGAPTPHPNAEKAAVLSAIEMVRRLREMEAADPTHVNGFYHIKVGVHRGTVILGNVGSADRTEYAAVGDDVNLGSRIMSMAKPLGAEILISGDVLAFVKDLPGIKFESKGQHLVKGRDEPVDLYQLIVSGDKNRPIQSQQESSK